MAKPLTVKEQITKDYFVAHEIHVVYFSATVFDAVWNKKLSGKIDQAMINLNAC